jgi:hypothetical protein
MFACFSKETALPPPGLLGLQMFVDPFRHGGASSDEGMKRQGSRKLDEHRSAHLKAKLVDLGDGNGFVFAASPFCHHATDGQVSCVFAGEIAQRPDCVDVVAANHNAYVTGEDGGVQDEATWLLNFYKVFLQTSTHGVASEALLALTKLEGQFAFVVYDNAARRVMAARDAAGSQNFFWGFSPDGSMMFSCDLNDLSGCEPSATAFPSGSLYISETSARAVQPGMNGWMIGHHVVPGELLSFVPRKSPSPSSFYRRVKEVPRVNSKGCLYGSVYRVASESNMADWGATF